MHKNIFTMLPESSARSLTQGVLIDQIWLPAIPKVQLTEIKSVVNQERSLFQFDQTRKTTGLENCLSRLNKSSRTIRGRTKAWSQEVCICMVRPWSGFRSGSPGVLLVPGPEGGNFHSVSIPSMG